MTTAKIHKDVTRWLQTNRMCKFVITNTFVFDGWECDVYGITAGDMCIEVEVKVSKNDFLADFAKDQKHYNTSFGRGANEFYFAVPPDMVNYVRDRLPEYAGLISYGWNHQYMRQYVPAPRLHNNFIDPSMWKKLAIKLFDKQ